jgi:rhamnulokinase
MGAKRFLAFDLGAESGRAVVGTLDGTALALEEIHRFPNEPVEVRGTVHWDVLRLLHNVKQGMREYVARYGSSVEGVGVDTWGVDFGLLAHDGSLLQNPVHYRDRRTDGIPDAIAERIPLQEVFEKTGVWILPIYTLCQMASLRFRESPVLAAADTFLMMADLMHYFLCGRRAVERSNAITTEMYDPRAGTWHRDIFEALDLPVEIMPEIVDPGTVLGELDEAVKRDVGLESAPVIATCTHDTGGAVAAVPAAEGDWAFLSSGTWSILGGLVEEVVTTPEAYRAHVCNEMALGSLFLCRNIMGLWLLQQARAAWERQGRAYSYGELAELAAGAPADGPLVEPDYPGFMAPDDMTAAIRLYCERTGQHPPQDVPAMTRCILDSLALSYRHGLEQLARLRGTGADVLHIVGGGSQNTLLCRLTADATELPVMAGPVEATVAGNVLVQALARGFLNSPQDVRDVVRASTDCVQYAPQDVGRWHDRYAEYLRLVEDPPAPA